MMTIVFSTSHITMTMTMSLKSLLRAQKVCVTFRLKHCYVYNQY